MKIKDATVFITGANRGLGQSFVRAAQALGAKKIYAAARDPSSVTLPGVVPVKLDVTSGRDTATLATSYPDVTVLINNAGIARGASFLAEGGAQAARAEMETNFFGPLATSQAFAPVLRANGGGAIVNVLSVLSWLNIPSNATYSASKSAAWSLTNGLRGELRGQGTQVLGLHVGYMDTDMTKGISGPKADPDVVALETLQALEAGKEEFLADELSRGVKLGLAAERGVYLGEPAQ
jgi:NAD(P)-dependent dehydrogenase (short-subunit alcohol dehydrogenase family)